MSAAVRDIIDLKLVKSLATPSNFRMGKELLRLGDIDFASKEDDLIIAAVRNAETRRVMFASRPGGLRWRCTCNSRGIFCKHCVAVALALNEF